MTIPWDPELLFDVMILLLWLNGIILGLISRPWADSAISWILWRGKPHAVVVISMKDPVEFGREWDQWATFKKEHPDFVVVVNDTEVE